MGDFFTDLFSGMGQNSSALSTGEMDALISGIGNMSQDELNLLDFSGYANGALGTDPSLWSQFSNGAMNTIGNQSFTDMGKLGIGAFGAYNQYQGQKEAERLANRNQAMDEDAYMRNKVADQRRQQLRF